MAKVEIKSKVNEASVDAFIDQQPEAVAAYRRRISKLMKKA